MPKMVAVASLTVCVQAICTEWSKSSRGGEESVQRSRVPEALKLPKFSAPDHPVSYILHQARYTERNGFRVAVPNELKITAYEPVEMHGVSLALSEDFLIVYYQWTPRQGAPPRPTNKKEVFALAVGEWGQVCYNGRHTDWDKGGWTYDKWVYNVGLFSSPTRSVFLRKKPTQVSLHMGHLW